MIETATNSKPAALAKESRLIELIAAYENLGVAYSGGVDSSYLSDVANETLGRRARILLADSASVPRSEVEEATALAHARGWNFETIATNEFANEAYLQNDGTRCYHCRAELFTKMRGYAAANGITTLAYGAIVDDLLDPTRLGHQAAQEHRVVAPLQEADLSKDEIRELSARRGLPTADKASFACLASRVPVGTRVEVSILAQVEAAEEAMKALGFYQYRARHHGDVCRLEIDPRDFPKLFEGDIRARLVEAVREAGYKHVALDLAGYRTGSTAEPSE
jgi:pyridinium-3,5-biscarboxylic acid mononucleotide sulfurtransferase